MDISANKAAHPKGNNTILSRNFNWAESNGIARIAMPKIASTITFVLSTPSTIGTVFAFKILSPLMSSMSFMISLARLNKNAKAAKINDSESMNDTFLNSIDLDNLNYEEASEESFTIGSLSITSNISLPTSFAAYTAWMLGNAAIRLRKPVMSAIKTVNTS